MYIEAKSGDEMSQLRWNPLLGEWVIVTPSRADRPFQEKDHECPFCPSTPETAGEWRVLTLDNKFPALDLEPGPIPLDTRLVMEAPAYGVCQVIVESRDHNQQFEDMDDEQLLAVMQEYLRVYQELSALRGIHYVMLFENRGRSIGVSLDHPHAQVYALPFIPSRIQREIEQLSMRWEEIGVCSVCEVVEKELKHPSTRVILETENFISLVPFYARLPYEVHIYPKQHVGCLEDLEEHLLEIGTVIKDTVTRYSHVFKELAYIMAIHTRPIQGDHPYWHFHIEFYPPWRDEARVKYLGGIETGAWLYTNDSTPEQKGKELRDVL